MPILLRAFFSIIFFTAIVTAQTAYNVSLLGSFNKYASQTKSNYSEIWGWYDSLSQREYAIIGTDYGTSIVDITDTLLREVDFLIGPTSSWDYHEFKTYQHYLYIGSEGLEINRNAGIQIVDMQFLPDSAHFIKSYIWIDTNTVTNTTRNYLTAHTVSIEKNFLYINGGDFGGTRILDISDPVSPRQVGSYGKGSTPYVHDSFILHDTLYAACISKGTLDIVDLRNKTHLTQTTAGSKLISSTPSPERRIHNVWLTEDAQYALTTDEVIGGHLRIWDIRDRTAPIQVSEWISRSTVSIHNVIVKGDFAYIAYYGDGFRVLDISNPSDPIEVGFYDTFPGLPLAYHNATFYGAWGIYPFFPSGRIIVSDMNYGLFVLDVEEKYAGKIVVRLSDTQKNPISNAVITVKELGRDFLTDNNGTAMISTASGDHTFSITHQGYIPATFTAQTPAKAIDTVSVTMDIETGIKKKESLPTGIILHNNYPNPFNPDTQISYELPDAAEVSLEITDVLGNYIRTISQGRQESGYHEVFFSAADLSSGIYFALLKTPTTMNRIKMVMIK